jgi:mannitol/fructose-specific phosphotransferase system IIA component (Ntr-type)
MGTGEKETFPADLIILDLKGRTKEEVFLEITHFAKEKGLIKEEKNLYDKFKVILREKVLGFLGLIMIENGVACVEAQVEELLQPNAKIVCRTINPIDFDYPDITPARIILVFLFRNNYELSKLLRPIVQLSGKLRNDRYREEFFKTENADEVQILLSNSYRRYSFEMPKGNSEYSKNQFILRWWNEKHDNLLREQIMKEKWFWYWMIREKIVCITSSEVIKTWQAEDPLCKKYAWYNILMYFAISRAEMLGFSKLIKSPEKKICLLCKKEFFEDTISYSFVKKLGINNLDFCPTCLEETISESSGKDNLTKEEVIQYLRDLAEILEEPPGQKIGTGKSDFTNLGTQQRVKIFEILKRKPSIECIKKIFGTWHNALIEAGLIIGKIYNVAEVTRNFESNKCPFCYVSLEKIPLKKKKCPHCGNYIYVRTEPTNRKKILVTKEQASQIDLEWKMLTGK